MATTYGPEFFARGPDGKILLAPLIDAEELRDEPAPAPQPAPSVEPAAAAQPGPRRRGGDAPTPIGALRPGAGDPAPAAQPEPPVADTPPAATLAAGASGAPAPAPPATLTRAIVVFDAPDGAPVGALEPGRGYSLVEERGGWRQLDVPGSGVVWARAWEMDGQAPPSPAPLPTMAPAAPAQAPAPPPAPAQVPAVVAPAGPAVTCLPVVDADNGGRYLGDACGATSEERQARALELLQAAPPPTLQQP